MKQLQSKKNKKAAKKKRFDVTMGIIWGIIISVLVICIVKIYTPEEPYYYRSEYILESVMAEKYGDVYERMENVATSGIDITEFEEFTELNAVKNYMQAAGLFKIYEESGNEELASGYAARMSEESAKMQGLSYTKAEIDAMLHLTE